MGTNLWHPWRFAARRFPNVVIDTQHQLPAGIAGLIRGDRVWLCCTLDRAGRRSVLTHELWHLLRGPTPDWAAIKEEVIVDRLAARQLITVDQLVDGLRWSNHEAELAEHFDVDLHTVEIRLQSLTPDEKAYIDAHLDDEEIA